MKYLRKMLGMLVIAIAIFAVAPAVEADAAGVSGVQMGADGGWYYYTNGQIDYNYTGLAANEFGWWYINQGVLDFNYTGLVPNESGWWYVNGGAIDFNATGLVPNEFGWWYVNGGAIDFNATGLVPNEFGWWMVVGGAIDFGYNGLVANEYGWWYVQNGAINFGYTGMASNEFGWWYVNDGAIDFNYTGLATNDAGTWYYKNGMLDFGYTGVVTVDGVQYNVAGGYVTGVVQDGSGDNTGGGTDDSTDDKDDSDNEATETSDYKVGTKVTEAVTDGIYIILSNANPNYALTVVEDKTSVGGYNLVMSKLTGDESQKFMVIKLGDDYGFLSMKYLDEDGTSPDGKWLINAYYGGWDATTATNADNVQVTSVNAGGCMAWKLEEIASGEYAIRVSREDYKLYMNVADKVFEGANVQAGGNGGNTLTVNFVSPYTKTLEDGIYQITLSDDTSKILSIENASVKDNSKLVVAGKTAGNEQLFEITCVDSVKGLYTIQNVNSQRFLYTAGSVEIGATVEQVMQSGLLDQQWYIQKKGNDTYSIINANSNQVLTASGAEIAQGIGKDVAAQEFTIKAPQLGTESLSTGVYTVGNTAYRVSHMGYGVYNIYSIAKGGYCAVSGDSVAYVAADDSDATKWKITVADGKYVMQSMSNGRYLAADGSVTSSAQALTVSDASASITNYAQRYDLSTFANLNNDAYAGVRVVQRMKVLGLVADELLDPIPKISTIEKAVEDSLSALPTEVVEFTGETVKELNDFMKDNTGKVVRLTKDIQVKPVSLNGDNDMGQIRIPSNVILDGNGHKLVQATETNKLPNVGIVFYFNDDNNNWKETVSSYCGVKNLTSAIPYEACTLSSTGADYIIVEGNNFSNAGMSAILLNDSSHGETIYGIIRNNVLSATGGDTLGVYGNNSMLVISGNEISKSGKYGLMVSCLRDEEPIPVEQQTDGPHDIVVKNNKVHDVNDCAMYYLGAYRVYVTGNELYNSKLEGVCLDSGCIGVYFANNIVHNTSLAGGLPGISIDNGIYNIIDGNNVYDNACVGIKVVRAGYCNVIVNNICTNNNKLVEAEKSNIGISIEVKPIDTHYVTILDQYGSDANVVYNNTINVGHYNAIMVSEDASTGRNVNNVVKYNVTDETYAYPVVDFSTANNDVKDNVIR